MNSVAWISLKSGLVCLFQNSLGIEKSKTTENKVSTLATNDVPFRETVHFECQTDIVSHQYFLTQNSYLKG